MFTGRNLFCSFMVTGCADWRVACTPGLTRGASFSCQVLVYATKLAPKSLNYLGTKNNITIISQVNFHKYHKLSEWKIVDDIVQVIEKSLKTRINIAFRKHWVTGNLTCVLIHCKSHIVAKAPTILAHGTCRLCTCILSFSTPYPRSDLLFPFSVRYEGLVETVPPHVELS
jgi:hypothetical protein